MSWHNSTSKFCDTDLFTTVYGTQAQLTNTFVDDIFAGRLISTVVCQDCGNVSLSVTQC